eukprot:Blabericola_migrator_1__4380@NODE_2351_length_2902_cov_16_492416_g1470_i0_p4_GENE_NODE_2351_length_2902_cov_16_492416_g1470_i0NODE_2351_length_2902_cov_16_492416_g1470_i0_p4_ORF_typecomplete_len120_score16_77_NODE_2351_length_2902_cov_16_492416_g1470_i022422601
MAFMRGPSYTPIPTPSQTSTQPATLDFTYPVFPAFNSSDATAVGMVASQTAPWVSRLANAVWGQCVVDGTMAVLPYAAGASVMAAIAGAVHCHYNHQSQDGSDININHCIDAIVDNEGE